MLIKITSTLHIYAYIYVIDITACAYCFFKAKGVITFNGFMKLMEHYKRKSANLESVGNFPATADEELKQIFNVFDKNGDGSISSQEMQSTMKVG